MSWSTIRDGVKTRLDTISGLSARDVAPETLPDRDTATVLPGDPLWVPYGHAGKVEYHVIVRVRCVRGKLKDSQDAMDAYLNYSGTNSIPAAIEGGHTLSGTVDDVKCDGVWNYGPVENTAGVEADLRFTAVVSA